MASILNNRIRGKNIVITGASGGLGEQLAYLCAKNGANLFLLARNKGKLDKVVATVHQQYAVKCTAFALDVSQGEQVKQVFLKIMKQAGTIDVLVNNAGFGIFAEAKNTDSEDVEAMFAVNTVGLITCTQQVIPSMSKQQYGHIINIASQAGKIATPKSSVYAATKHAVLGYTNALRMEMSQVGVYVTAVNPGPIRTGFFQTADPGGSYLENVGRLLLEPEKVAEKIVRVMLSNKREINLPRWMNSIATLHTMMPSIVERLGKKAFFKK